MNTPISRRRILKLMAALAGGVGLAGVQRMLTTTAAPSTADLKPQAYLPHISNSESVPPTATNTRTATATATPTSTPTPTPTATETPGTPPVLQGKVIHVHSLAATTWTGQTAYWNYVNQSAVTNMVNQGLMSLTGTSDVAAAWRALLPNYQSGQNIAIKVSFNNTLTCNNTGNKIDGIIEPVNALASGLQQIGVDLQHIWVYDATRALPDRFVNGGLAGIRYFDGSYEGVCRNPAGFDSGLPGAHIAFSPPSGVPLPPDEYLADVLVNAHYLINLPIMKRHVVGVSLGFKNHFGSIDNPGGLHSYIDPGGQNYRSDYSPLVDLYKNSHLRDKTVLTVGDGLFAAKNYTSGPETWTTFGGKLPNSLFFSTDPVAIDCVMHDFVAAEMTDLTPHANDYLRAAHAGGLGVYEQGSPWGSGYSQIHYSKIEL